MSVDGYVADVEVFEGVRVDLHEVIPTCVGKLRECDFLESCITVWGTETYVEVLETGGVEACEKAEGPYVEAGEAEGVEVRDVETFSVVRHELYTVACVTRVDG